MGRKFLLTAILAGVLVWSCGNKQSTSDMIDQGVITYHVEYLCSQDDNPLISLLPSTMDYKFKKHNISLTTEGYLGFFSSRFISKAKSDNSNILLKVLDKKCNYPFPKDEIAFGYKQLPSMKIQYSDSTKNIAGYKCKMATIRFKDKNIDPINIFYTNDIGIKQPNRNTPFHQLPGVLMEFSMRIHNIDTHIKAIQVVQADIPDSEFQIPADYKKVTRKEIQNFFVGFN